MIKKVVSKILILTMIIQLFSAVAFAAEETTNGFKLIETAELADFEGTAYYYEHIKTGAEVVYLDNGSERKDFVLGFKTPPADNKGANHVLEHSLLCGSDKYPINNIMHYLDGCTLAESVNAKTIDDYTYYEIKTANEKEYYGLMDIYLNGIFHPLFLKDENIFKQQGIRLEYRDGKIQYNGVVYNELRIKSLDTDENSVSFLSDKLYHSLYGDTTPNFSSGGTVEAIKTLTYEDLLNVYNTYYVPSNSMTFIAGNQDINKTLKILDDIFSGFGNKSVDVQLADTKQIPEQNIYKYNMDENTKSVDIGFMSAGALMSGDVTERYARAIIFNILLQKMGEIYPNTYITGGNSGGIENSALLVSEIPIENAENVISDYNQLLSDMETNGIDETVLDNTIASYFEERKISYYYPTEQYIFESLLYKNNPFEFANLSDVEKTLKENKDIFVKVLKQYFSENPYSVIVVSGNQKQSNNIEELNFTSSEIEEIKRETEDFQKWADTPTSKSEIEKIPFLTLDEANAAPEYYVSKNECVNDIDFYHTDNRNSSRSRIKLYTPLNVSADELHYVTLLTKYINSAFAEQGFESVYVDAFPMENYKNGRLNPQYAITIYGTEDNIVERLNKTTEFLRNDELFNKEKFAEYIKAEPDNILSNAYRDPYYLSYELMQSSMSQGNHFQSRHYGSIGMGSVPYYNFIININDTNTVCDKVKSIAEESVLNNVSTVEYFGEGEYENVKSAVLSLYKSSKLNEKMNFVLPIGYNNAATITKLKTADHCMLLGNFEESGYNYSGKLDVLAKVLTTNYLLPEMRGKYGAYGAGILVDKSGFTSAVSGMENIENAIMVWDGMGDYLRNLDMTQKQLDAVIVTVVKTFDELYNDSDYAAQMALMDKSADDIKRTRDEMLSTTVEDLIGYADFIDKCVSQNHIYAVLSKEAADNAKFDFSYYANPETVKITPQLTKNPQGYIQGKAENIFAPDDYITRAEVAAIIDRIIADKRTAQYSGVFSDVKENEWYFNAVVSLNEKGIISGYETGEFKPGAYITRAELATILSKFIYNADSDNGLKYSDVNGDEWYYASISAMINKGYINGYEDNTIRPNQPVTRAETVAIINRMLGLSAPANNENSFVDVDTAHWAYSEIMAASK